jgi:hypothetical protein
MKTATVAGVALAALCGCAQTTNLTGGAEQQCAGLARGEGMRVNEAAAAENTGGGQNVRMQLEDAVGRRFEATCVYSTASGTRWLTPLPSNAARR